MPEAKVRAAFEARRPGCGRGRRGADEAALAEALGLERAKVTAAFEKLRAARVAEREAHRTAVADALATELGIDAAKVRAALAGAHGRVLGGGRRHLRRGPGRP